jgi:hypothetical protein
MAQMFHWFQCFFVSHHPFCLKYTSVRPQKIDRSDTEARLLDGYLTLMRGKGLM